MQIDIIKNKLLLNIQAQDIFSGTKSNNRTEYKDYVFRNRINNDNTSFRVRLTYNFGKQKAKKADINISNNETNRLPDIKK